MQTNGRNIDCLFKGRDGKQAGCHTSAANFCLEVSSQALLFTALEAFCCRARMLQSPFSCLQADDVLLPIFPVKPWK